MDREDVILEQVRKAVEARTPLAINGGGSKAFYAQPRSGEPLDLSGHAGIVEYDPGELVVTCRAGTPLAELRQALAEQGQHLPFEPPAFGEKATVGGTVACGFSGPRRPWAGSLRDYLLGVRIINGRGKALRFGGQVMKNVAGYDVSRLMAGSLGTLGVILETSFKVLPQPLRERTLRFEMEQREALGQLAKWSGKPLPLSASCWRDGQLFLRLSGAERETARAAESLGGEAVDKADAFWRALREHEDEFFSRGPLWRLSLPPTAEPIDLDRPCLVEWGGAQRWYATNASPERIRAAAASAGGHATLFRGDIDDIPRFHPQAKGLLQLQERVREAFDPHGLFNRGLLAPKR